MAATVLALWLAERTLPAARLEAWRTLVAARAAGHPVRILDLRTSPTAHDPADDEARLLDALAREDASPERPTPTALLDALRKARSLVALLDASRPVDAPLLLVDDALLTQPAEVVLARLNTASAVLRS